MSGVALSWSGGKDSALALQALRDELRITPHALVTTITTDYRRVSIHGVRRELVRAQAEAAGLPLVEVGIPVGCTNALYEEQLAEALKLPPLNEVRSVAFGDLFLDDVRAYREAWFCSLQRESLFPLWGRETKVLAHRFIDSGFKAVLTCVDPNQLDPSFVGRPFDKAFLAELPAGVDPCGENGEFHTFVYGGPIFERWLPLEIGQVSQRDGFAFCDLTA